MMVWKMMEDVFPSQLWLGVTDTFINCVFLAMIDYDSQVIAPEQLPSQ